MIRITHFTIAVLLLAVLAMPAHAQSWDSAQPTGITFVDSVLDPMTNTFTWTLTNNGGQADLPCVLIWSLEPFNVPAPTAWTAPAGWEWDGSGWQSYEISQPSKKYFTPPAIAPGQSATFTYTFNPSAPKINPFGAGYTGYPDAIGFLCHVGQVVPGSGSLDGSVRWVAQDNPMYGQTWFDKSGATFDPPYPPIPEPSALIVLCTGFISLAGLARRRA